MSASHSKTPYLRLEWPAQIDASAEGIISAVASHKAQCSSFKMNVCYPCRCQVTHWVSSGLKMGVRKQVGEWCLYFQFEVASLPSKMFAKFLSVTSSQKTLFYFKRVFSWPILSGGYKLHSNCFGQWTLRPYTKLYLRVSALCLRRPVFTVNCCACAVYKRRYERCFLDQSLLSAALSANIFFYFSTNSQRCVAEIANDQINMGYHIIILRHKKQLL